MTAMNPTDITAINDAARKAETAANQLREAAQDRLNAEHAWRTAVARATVNPVRPKAIDRRGAEIDLATAAQWLTLQQCRLEEDHARERLGIARLVLLTLTTLTTPQKQGDRK